MKRIIIWFLPALFYLVSCSDQERTRISGRLDDGRDIKIYLDKLEVGGPVLTDSLKTKSSGDFRFTVKLPHPAFYRVRIGDNNFITLLAEPGERIFIEAEASDLPGTYNVSGSEGSELVKKLHDRLLITKKQIRPLINEIVALEEGPGFYQEEARINEELAELIRAQRNFSISLIMENMESLAAITALYQKLDDENYVLNQTLDIQYLKIVAQSLLEKYPQSAHVRALAADAENQERQYELYKLLSMAEETGDVHTTYPDIAMPGVHGDTISLHSLEEKYVLLFFGSSLNQASVQLSHDLIPVYRDYHSKGFQIYQVSVERDREEWINGIRFSELPWVNVAELGGGNFDAAVKYNVQQIPSNYLINRDAGVVAANLSAPELRRRLSRALD